ncbi:HepT-like ribonuclease domain-containing protein [Planomonospora alba]|uniref:HepT-like ribonuclease domain-containing protein n=1 Tax=Planomonospora alba TaxID=161354 RepID=UPI0031E86D0C
MRSIAAFLEGAEETRWLSDEQLQSAVQWKLMNIGEAASGISEATRTRRPDVPWKRIHGFRNVLAHAYFSVGLDAVWTTCNTSIPALEKDVLDLLWLMDPDRARRFGSPHGDLG